MLCNQTLLLQIQKAFSVSATDKKTIKKKIPTCSRDTPQRGSFGTAGLYPDECTEKYILHNHQTSQEEDFLFNKR